MKGYFEELMGMIEKSNKVLDDIQRAPGRKLEKMINETLFIETDDEGNAVISESSIKNLIDDVETYFVLVERKEEDE